MEEPRYVIIHGHFYQPPRESPWTGLITPEEYAAPFANWNERILSECYNANAHAQMMDGRVVHIRNNYEELNFDLGPTLASWLERHGKNAHRGFRRGDEASRLRHDGHGNAMAQAYNHSILPLLNGRDKALQIEWGIADFIYRFGRRPAGMWLPECAVDDATLAALVAAGLRYTILAPEQGRFSEDAPSRAAGPFLWGADGAGLAVFRFDRELSRAIAFNDLLEDGARLAESIAAVALTLPPGAALLLAIDGETFGHHKRSGAAELARTLALLEQQEGLAVTNCEAYLAGHAARGRVALDGASAWSCPHGVERWRANCGCRLDARTGQEWRAPLRATMEFVKNHAEATYDRFAPPLVTDAQRTLLESATLLVDPRADATERFFARFPAVNEHARERLLRLFELERAAQATLTSCAWFFDDFGGLEGRIALRWAARAIELAAEFTPSIEAEVLERLRQIQSNRREVGDAATLYLSLKTRELRGRI